MPAHSTVPQGVKPAVKDKCADVVAGTGNRVRNVWGYAAWPDHNNRRCIDFMIKSRAGGDDVAAYLIKHAKRLGVLGIIWNGRCMGFPHGGMAPWRGPSGKWRNYTGQDQHTDHVHAEFDADPITGAAPAEDKPAKDKPSKGYPRPTSGEVYLDKLRPGTRNSDSVYYWQMALNAISFRGGSELKLDGDYDAAVKHETKLFQDQICHDPQDGWPGPKQAALAFNLAEREMRRYGVRKLTIYRDSQDGGLVNRMW